MRCYPDYTIVQAILAINLPVLRVACSVGHSPHAHFATDYRTSWLIMNISAKIAPNYGPSLLQKFGKRIRIRQRSENLPEDAAEVTL